MFYDSQSSLFLSFSKNHEWQSIALRPERKFLTKWPATKQTRNHRKTRKKKEEQMTLRSEKCKLKCIYYYYNDTITYQE